MTTTIMGGRQDVITARDIIVTPPEKEEIVLLPPLPGVEEGGSEDSHKCHFAPQPPTAQNLP